MTAAQHLASDDAGRAKPLLLDVRGLKKYFPILSLIHI